MSAPKIVKSKQPLGRRNTINTMFEELVANADIECEKNPPRSNKRNMKLLRGSERDLKLDIASAQAVSEQNTKQAPQPSYQIESCKRFMSLSCRTVPCFKKRQTQKSQSELGENLRGDVVDECPSSRVDFYNTFSMLLRMGCGSRERKREVSFFSLLFNHFIGIFLIGNLEVLPISIMFVLLFLNSLNEKNNNYRSAGRNLIGKTN